MSFLQYSNVYIPTPEINQLIHDKKLQEECLQYVGKKGKKYCSWRSIQEICRERGIWAFLKPENHKRKKDVKIQNTDPLSKSLKNGKLRDFNATFALHFLACC